MSQKENNNSLLINQFKVIWREFIEAMNGSDRDFTQIPLRSAVFLLAVPMVVEMIMESVFALVDIYFVSQLGADAVATVGITESLMTLMYALAFGLSTATTALVSRRIGEKRKKLASLEATQAIITAISISLIIMIPGIVYASEMLELMGASLFSVDHYSSYPAIMFGGNIVIMLLFVNNAIFRGAGDAAIAMKVLIIGNVLNIALDPILIHYYGIAGAAIATNIGRGVAVIFQFYVLIWGSSHVNIKGLRFIPDWKRIRHIISISLGGIAQSLIATMSWVFMMRLMARFGSNVVAGYTIAIRMVVFAILPSWGLSNAASTLVGQNLGADRPDRAERIVWRISIINTIGLGLIGIILSLIPDVFISFFTNDSLIIEAGEISLRIISYGFAFYGLGMVMTQAFNGAGDTITPTRVNVVAFWIIEIPLAWVLSSKTGLNETGVYYGIIIAESFLALYAFILFRKGKWKVKKV
ncbi:MAG: MATE family efflux transporter [Marinilabiliaceae bacterium]|nr:MATE family efflux transporter [Marinilabiliaceae bacterium]